MDLPLPGGCSLGDARIGAYRLFFDAEERDDARPATADLHWIQLPNHQCRYGDIESRSIGQFFLGAHRRPFGRRAFSRTRTLTLGDHTGLGSP